MWLSRSPSCAWAFIPTPRFSEVLRGSRRIRRDDGLTVQLVWVGLSGWWGSQGGKAVPSLVRVDVPGHDYIRFLWLVSSGLDFLAGYSLFMCIMKQIDSGEETYLK
jgi:hypothetical protein